MSAPIAIGNATRQDYEAWCPKYWKGCASCPGFNPMRELFCKSYNLRFRGVIPNAEIGPDGWGRFVNVEGEERSVESKAPAKASKARKRRRLLRTDKGWELVYE